MNRSNHPWTFYSHHAAELCAHYESVTFEDVHATWRHLLPTRPGLALDVGAGSGRDAAWLAERGWDVVAVEPAQAMREAARRNHPSARIRWLDDRMPSLDEVQRLDFRFDVILLGAVWMHVAPGRRERAFRRLANLLKPGGLLVVTLRQGPPDPARTTHPTDVEELSQLGRRLALEPVPLPESRSPDRLGRPDVEWITVAFRLPDDGTGALPLLRHVIINDAKSSTYKLALLRVLVRIADGARGMVLEERDGRVVLPFGLVALYWLKVFRPLVGEVTVAPRAEYPQQATRRAGLGFVKEGFRGLAAVSPVDFCVGARFEGPDAAHLVGALRDICRTIRTMPATYTTWPGSDEPVFDARPTRGAGRTPRVVAIDRPFLRSFGTFSVPSHVWHAMSRYACWIEPAIVREWVELMRGYDAARDGAPRTLDDYHRALSWLDPIRDTEPVRERVRLLLDERRGVHCVWSGKRLRASSRFEIDHCFPFACWPNNDLWNLMPASASVNQQKGRRIPSAELLHGARDRILDWWQAGYGEWGVVDRFRSEAVAALPSSAGIGGDESGSDPWAGVFAGLDVQRARLRADQQLEEWSGTS